ncbi:MAG: cytochrome c peroxidase [Betaproteobacteria bacterium]|nr:cytochrome c peroxidase [Betaproteobacteria bacterium]
MQLGTKAGAKAAVLGALALLATAGIAGDDASFTDSEIRAILAHGPWPAAATSDPTNRASGQRDAIYLGEILFFDKRLSPAGKFACNTCHVPERNWTDNRTRGAALAEVDRNTPTLMNLRLGRSFGWDGATDRLWAQSIRPILDPRELGASPRHVAELVRKDPQLACRYEKAFGAAPSASDDQAVLADLGRALGALVETFETPPTPFDRFRNALARGERIQPWVYSEVAQRGAKIFVGKGNCSSCHSGPNFTNGELHDNGFSKLAATGRADPGRNGTFKVPTLRHLLLTAPYGHHGEVATLAQAVRHYSETGSREIEPRKLTAAEQSDLVVFLESLSTFSNPWRPEDKGTCF